MRRLSICPNRSGNALPQGIREFMGRSIAFLRLRGHGPFNHSADDACEGVGLPKMERGGGSILLMKQAWAFTTQQKE